MTYSVGLAAAGGTCPTLRDTMTAWSSRTEGRSSKPLEMMMLRADKVTSWKDNRKISSGGLRGTRSHELCWKPINQNKIDRHRFHQFVEHLGDDLKWPKLLSKPEERVLCLVFFLNFSQPDIQLDFCRLGDTISPMPDSRQSFLEFSLKNAFEIWLRQLERHLNKSIFKISAARDKLQMIKVPVPLAPWSWGACCGRSRRRRRVCRPSATRCCGERGRRTGTAREPNPWPQWCRNRRPWPARR